VADQLWLMTRIRQEEDYYCCCYCRYYLATVDEILDDGTCSVIFDKYNTPEVTQVGLVCWFTNFT